MNAVLELRDLGQDLPPVRRVLREAMVALLRAVGLVEDEPSAVQELREALVDLGELLLRLASLRVAVRAVVLPAPDVAIDHVADHYAYAVDALDRLDQLRQGLSGLTGREVVDGCRLISPELGDLFARRAREANANLDEQRSALAEIVDELENRYDVEQSERALAEQGDEPLIPYEQVRRELGL